MLGQSDGVKAVEAWLMQLERTAPELAAAVGRRRAHLCRSLRVAWSKKWHLHVTEPIVSGPNLLDWTPIRCRSIPELGDAPFWTSGPLLRAVADAAQAFPETLCSHLVIGNDDWAMMDALLTRSRHEIKNSKYGLGIELARFENSLTENIQNSGCQAHRRRYRHRDGRGHQQVDQV